MIFGWVDVLMGRKIMKGSMNLKGGGGDGGTVVTQPDGVWPSRAWNLLRPPGRGVCACRRMVVAPGGGGFGGQRVGKPAVRGSDGSFRQFPVVSGDEFF